MRFGAPVVPLVRRSSTYPAWVNGADPLRHGLVPGPPARRNSRYRRRHPRLPALVAAAMAPSSAQSSISPTTACSFVPRAHRESWPSLPGSQWHDHAPFITGWRRLRWLLRGCWPPSHRHGGRDAPCCSAVRDARPRVRSALVNGPHRPRRRSPPDRAQHSAMRSQLSTLPDDMCSVPHVARCEHHRTLRQPSLAAVLEDNSQSVSFETTLRTILRPRIFLQIVRHPGRVREVSIAYIISDDVSFTRS